MAFSSEVTAKLKLDTTDFQRSLTRTEADLANIGNSVDKKLSKSFGAKGIAKGILAGTGISSIDKIVDKLSAGFEKAAESAKQIAESTAKTLGIYQQIFEGRRTDEQNLEMNRKEQARLQKELANEVDKTTTTTQKTWNPATQRFEDRQVTTKTEANQVRRAEIAGELAELAKKEEELKRKIADSEKKSADEVARGYAEQARAMEELEQMRKENARDEMETAEHLAELQNERDSLLRDSLRMGFQTNEETKTLLDLEKKITDLKKKQAEEAKKAADEAQRQAEKINRIYEELERGQKKLAKAESNYAQAVSDTSAFSIEDVAGGKGGSPTERALARRALRLEASAKRIRGMTSLRDASGNPISAESEANRRVEAAAAIRSGIGSLTSADKNPFKQMADDIAESRDALQEINIKLTATAIGDAATPAGNPSSHTPSGR